ncbi:maleylacetate reductase [Tardibacter chloracetimidivorans]|uniref:Maleylacetate reductase n=1 Tax=Tardibacter chloracetimidivorans TaxID=1921510 RepID=A0A1L3ZSP4_9SPHN|nr:maleylacetate reductase [Tardibacter chloracetimidivorans]API58629.1 maleylacetate reductase [Tardibacter chloracetimidivorans]
MLSFTYESLPARIKFGRGTIASLADAIEEVAGTRALLLSTPQQTEQAREATLPAEGQIVGHFDGATMHTPLGVTEQALDVLKQTGADCVISFGGGSTIGLGKALALRTGVPQIAIPTTYAGSEVTPILGETVDGRKTTQRSPKILPNVVIYDVEFTLSLPPALSGISGLNAIAHAVEGLYARDTNPLVQLMAEAAVRTLATSLPRIMAAPQDIEARSQALFGAWLCGTVLGSVGMALHHKLCHTLGGAFDLPHAETHSIVLPHALAFNAPMIPEAMAALRRALGTEDPAGALFNLGRTVGAPASLKALGMPEAGIQTAAEQAVKNPYWNPRPVEFEAIRTMVARAYAGERPVEG